MTPEDFERVGIKAMDASLSMVRNGTGIDFYHSESGTDVQKFRGTLERPAQTSVYAGPSHLVNPRNVDGKCGSRTSTGYFYVYFTENGQPAVARAPVAEVLDAARRGA
jgi:hypothetical protein